MSKRRSNVQLGGPGSWKKRERYNVANPKNPKDRELVSPERLADTLRRAFDFVEVRIDGQRAPQPIGAFVGNVPSTTASPAIERAERRITELDYALRQARTKIQEQDTFLKQLGEKPQIVATVVRTTKPNRGIVSIGGTPMEINIPRDCRAGTQVLLLVETQQAVAKYDAPVLFGPTVTVERVSPGFVYFNQGTGALNSATVGFTPPDQKVEPGDRVRLDHTGVVALENLGRDKDSFSVGQVPNVQWSDIGGLEDAKEALREAIEYPLKYADVYEAYGQRASRGVLLYGPPGTGKTMLGKAVATAMGGAGFIYVKGPEVLSKWVGDSESAVRQLFDRARDHKRRTGKPAVIFIDEADALLGARGQSFGMTTLSTTLVPTFLAEMDGIDDSGAFVLLSTNRAQALDPAVVRDGRIDRRVFVGRPDRTASRQIFEIAMRGRIAADPGALAAQAVELLFGEAFHLYEIGFAAPRAIEHIGMRDFASGALIAGIVHRAAELAIKRDRASPDGKRTGIQLADVEAAMRGAWRELIDVNHNEAIRERLEGADVQPTHIRKANPNAATQEARFSGAIAVGNA